MEAVCASTVCSGEAVDVHGRREPTRLVDDAVARAWTAIVASAILLEQLHVNLTKSQAAVDSSRREVRQSMELIRRLSTPGAFIRRAPVNAAPVRTQQSEATT